MALTKIGASLGGGADTISVTQNNHGLLKGRAVKVTGNGTYGYAKADTAPNAEAIGIIIETTTNTMLIALSGKITVDGAIPTGNLAAGTVVFLSATSNTGELTSAEPTTAGHISKPMGVITYLNSEMIMIQQRGEVVSTGAATIADDSITNAKLTNMAANTVKVRDANSSGDPSDKAVADTQILIGDGTGFTAAALSGDVTMANTGAVTIATDAVDIAMLSATGTASNSTFLRGDNAWAAASPTFVGVKATATSAQTITTGGNRTIGYHSATTSNTTAFAFDSGYTGFDNGASSNETKLWRDEAGNNGGGIPWRSVLHVPVSGYYLISGSVGATNQGAGYYRIQFYNEAGQGFMQSRFEAFGDSDNVIQASCVAYLTGNTNGSNWIYMTLYQNSGSDMSVQPYASTGGTHFSLVKLG